MLYRDCPPHRTAIFTTPRVGRVGSTALCGGLLFLTLLGSACRGRTSHPTSHEEGAALLQQVLLARSGTVMQPAALPALSLELDGSTPLPLYDEAVDHPWNRVHQALYRHPGLVSRTSCQTASADAAAHSTSTGCASRTVPLVPWPPSVQERSPLGDTPSLLASRDVLHLAEPERAARLLALMQAASDRAAEMAQRPFSALLFQSDLWERFDALDEAARQILRNRQADSAATAPAGPGKDTADRLLFLRDAVGRLLRDVALPAAQIHGLDSNLPLLASNYPLLLPGFPGPDWVEIVTRSRSMPERMAGPIFEYTRHSMVAGFRAVFRRFIRVPQEAGGSAWLRRELASEPVAPKMPPGTRLVILQQPLAVTKEGQLALWPRTDLVELRTVEAAAEPGLQVGPPKRLSELSFDVLEGQRALLRQAQPASAGLRLLRADAPFPMGGSCSPQPTVLAPLRAVCMTCHGVRGDLVFGAMTHGPQKTRVLADPGLPFAAVRDEKQRRPEFKALLRSF